MTCFVAELSDLAVGILALERGEIKHAESQVERRELRILLDASFRQPAGSLFDADLIDGGARESARRERGGARTPRGVIAGHHAKRRAVRGGGFHSTVPELGGLGGAILLEA